MYPKNEILSEDETPVSIEVKNPFTVVCGRCDHTFPVEQGLAVDMSSILMQCPRCGKSTNYAQDGDGPFRPDDGWQ